MAEADMSLKYFVARLSAPTIIIGMAVTLVLGQFLTNWIATSLYPGFPHYQAGIGLQYLCYLAAAVVFFWAIGNLAPGYKKEGIMGLLTLGIVISLFTAFVGWYILPHMFPQFFAAFPVQLNMSLQPFAVVPIP